MLEHDIHGSKGGGKKPHTPVETPNNLLSTAYAKVLIAVAEGELAGTPTAQDIYLDGTPLANADGSLNFGGVKWEWRPGTSDQEYIAGLPEVSTEYSIGYELRNQFPWTRAITKTQLDAVRVTFQWNALLRQEDNGDTVGSVVEYAIEISTDGGAFEEYERYKIEGKTNTTYERTHRVDLPKANSGWTIRATRITQDQTSSKIQDKTYIKSVAEVVDAKQRYPNTALLYVEFDSRMFGGGNIPRVSVRTKGRIVRVPDNYDPENRTYSGVWSGVFKWAYTNNPAWILHDIMTQDRFGLGHKVTLPMVDKWAMYEISQHCDVMVPKGDGSGELEPRHTCNVYIQEKSDAWQVLRDIASCFNGMTYWNGTQFTAVADKRENLDNIPIFSRANVVNGRFDYNAADDKSIFTSALVSYDEPDDHYNTQVEATFETSQIIRWGSDRQTEISAIGCTSRGEAQRRGKYTLITNLYNRGVTFRTGLQGMDVDVMPGKLIHVADPLIGGEPFTGRLIAGTPTVVTLDREIKGKAGDILYITRSNGVTEGRTIDSVSGKVVTVMVDYTELPAPNAVWYLETQDLKSQLFRVTKVSAPEEGVYEISGVEYNDSKYAAIDTGARLEERPISKVPDGMQQPPQNLKLTAETYTEQTMAVTTMRISWDQTKNAVGYEGQWKVNEGDWVNTGITGANEFNIKGIYAGQYVARVRAINASGIKSVWTTSQLTPLNGKEGLPPAVAHVQTTPMFFGIRLDWFFPEGATDTLFTEFVYSENEDFNNAIPLGDFAYPRNSTEMHGLSAGKRFWFWCRLRDRTGNIGPWYPAKEDIGIPGQSMINDQGQYNDYLAGMISETALDKELYDRIDLIDGNGPGSVNDRLDKAVGDLQDQIDQISDALAYDPTKPDGYKKGDVVRLGNKLYQALKDVPMGVSPPNEEYWKDIGVILEETNGLVTRVDKNEEKIGLIDGKLTSVATSLESMQAAYRDDDGTGEMEDAIAGWQSRAQIIEEREVRATADEAIAKELVVFKAEIDGNAAKISTLTQVVADNDSATSSRLDALEAQVGDDIQAAIRSEAEARATADEALGKRIDVVSATMATDKAELQAAITAEQLARVTADEAMAQRVDTIEAGLITDTEVNALIQVEAIARANADGALGQRIDTVQIKVGENTASIQESRTAISDIDGRMKTSWSLKMEHQQDGKYVAAGIGLGIENGPAGLQSQFLVRADRFAVVSGDGGTEAAPFVVQGGQVFIKQALIGDGWITNAMIGNEIKSNNYVPGSVGWRIDKSGSIEINGNIPGTGRLSISNNVILVFDQNNTLRVRLGLW
ncbi:MAG: tail component [Caudoviricetes sp.]|nr:MAG: tail component [Caudoviricetes sp.]